MDIDAGEALVDAIKPHARATHRPGVVGGLGGFGAVFDPKAAGYRDPLLVSTTDGVGTKLKIAIETGRYRGVGIDLVAMCVNDLVVQGAEPLFFLDYYATGKLDVSAAAETVAGIAEGCRIAGCALVGGETAEMPGMYGAGDFDLAGFSVGAVERDALLPRLDVTPGDVVLGLPSTGFHSNGYSLVRKIVADSRLSWDAPAPFDADRSLAEALLEPTRIYVKECVAAHRQGLVKAFAHITGGGLLDNVPRVLPDGVGVELDAALWSRPPAFAWAAQAGDVAPEEMARTFNCGIGMVAIVAADEADEAVAVLTAEGALARRIGVVGSRAGDAQVVIRNVERLCA